MVVQWHAIQPQKLFRALLVSAHCIYCQWGNQEREESSYAKWRSLKKKKKLQMWGYSIFVSTYPILLCHKRFRFDWAFQKCKASRTISQTQPSQFKSCNSFLFNCVERLSSYDVGFEYSPFCLSGTASATIWHPVSALAQPFQGENDSLRELLLPGQYCPHKHESETEAHACALSHTILAALVKVGVT